MPKQHTEFMDQPTPEEIYIGRMVTELLKGGGTVTIDNSFTDLDRLRFTYDTGDWKKRACLQKNRKDTLLSIRPLNEANYDAEIVLKHHKENSH